MDNDPAFLATLKAGDTVILVTLAAWAKYASREIVTVRCTEHQVICGGVRFNRKNGQERGRTSSHLHLLEPCTPEGEELVRREKQLQHMARRTNRLTTEGLERLSREEIATLDMLLGKIYQREDGHEE